MIRLENANCWLFPWWNKHNIYFGIGMIVSSLHIQQCGFFFFFLYLKSDVVLFYFPVSSLVHGTALFYHLVFCVMGIHYSRLLKGIL